jgi:putative endonuclease
MEYFVYVLRSLKDGKFYTGYTMDLDNRLNEHNSGRVLSTNNRRPFELLYYEGSLDQNDALHREKYLKTTYGKRYLKQRLKHYLSK